MSVHVSTCGIPRTHEDHKLEQFEESMEMATAEAIKKVVLSKPKFIDKQILGFASLIPMSVHVSTCGIPRTHEDHKLEQFEESMEMATAEAIKRLFCPNLSSSVTNACHNAIKINDRTDHNSVNAENS
ncbi:hypothetical protein OIU79_023140 [Salix purpurea]|uniref:Uncharacterized protein n=1 Tax=Salix purpurea TaxID=77065 RepID=A0A9Q0WIY0_SALPP|nr:hypothetical protein OIU79_023140 [Salix purpurea]